MSNASYAAAREALLAGDATRLSAQLDAAPDLVTARWEGAEPPYDGYFHRATLLHHVAGNPQIAPQPANDVELARLLLDRGADIDAVTDAGPGQPDDIRWTVLGLVATSGQPGQLALLDFLVERGADLEARNGGALRGALYYHQPAAAERLVEHGARMDLAAAAGLGRLDVLEAMLADGEAGIVRAPRLAHYSLVPLPDEPSAADLLTIALVHASWRGQVAALERLVEAGADVNARPCFDHRASALHWAAQGDQPETAARLLAHGADPGARDESFHSTPRGWAEHMGCKQVLAVLP